MITVIAASAQVTYRTAQSGSYTVPGTWVGGAAATPPTSGVCNCKIVVTAGHQLTLNVDMDITNANFVLDGVNSVLTLGNNVDVILSGSNSSIDIQSDQARLSKTTGSAATITLGGQVIYNSTTTRFNSTTNGVVNGLASASSARANPQFQSGTLPVKLSEFSVADKASSVLLAWKTDIEVNSSHFEVERSADGKDWGSIGSVQASGNASVAQNYSFSDAAPLDGSNYYRLKMVDIDGRFEYSGIKSVTVTNSVLNVVTAPNPATSFINISVNQPGREPYRLRLINRAGQVVFDQKYAAANNRIQLSLSNYTDGSYFVEVTNSNGLRKINKVMIVRK